MCRGLRCPALLAHCIRVEEVGDDPSFDDVSFLLASDVNEVGDDPSLDEVVSDVETAIILNCAGGDMSTNAFSAVWPKRDHVVILNPSQHFQDLLETKGLAPHITICTSTAPSCESASACWS